MKEAPPALARTLWVVEPGERQFTRVDTLKTPEGLIGFDLGR
jgi:hypothetical protein